MLARVFSAAVNGIEAFPVEMEVNCGWGDTVVVMLSCDLPPGSGPNGSKLRLVVSAFEIQSFLWRKMNPIRDAV